MTENTHMTEVPVPTIAIIGLGKLGIPIAVALASRGFSVIGVDVCQDTVDSINQHKSPIYELGVQELLEEVSGRLTATTDVISACRAADIILVIVPTPSDMAGWFSLRHVSEACINIGVALKENPNYTLVVIVSTVMPTSMDKQIVPLLEQVSGKMAGVDFGVCYSPEFVALGSVIQDFTNPDFCLVGEGDEKAGDILERFYHIIYDGLPIARMNFVNAELTKLALNFALTQKITYANVLAQLCERLPNANVDIVTSAIGLDSRIGPRLLKGATSAGGPCLPRDLRALEALAHSLDLSGALPATVDYLNREMTLRLAEMVQCHAEGGGVGILGLAYKPDTDIVDNSPALLLIRGLIDTTTFFVYDPAAMKSTEDEIGSHNVHYCHSVCEVLDSAKVVVIMTPWDEFYDIAPQFRDGTTVIDCWRILDGSRLPVGVNYIALGIGT